MTKRDAALSRIIDELIHHVEQLACTCATTEQMNSRHCHPGRRRQDSACSGVAYAVKADMQRRKALRIKDDAHLFRTRGGHLDKSADNR